MSKATSDTIVVIGLGRFGQAVVERLSSVGRDVLVIDNDPGNIARIAEVATLAVEADATSITVLRELGVDRCESAVVAIGENLESSILAATCLSDLGVEEIWARAISQEHGRILERVGVHHVVYPEQEVGRRVGQQLYAKINEYVDFANGYAVSLMSPPTWAIGQTVGQVGIQGSHGVSVIGIERHPGEIRFPHLDHHLAKGERIVIAGPTVAVDRFTVSTE